mgnify:CR=1 FL=1
MHIKYNLLFWRGNSSTNLFVHIAYSITVKRFYSYEIKMFICYKCLLRFFKDVFRLKAWFFNNMVKRKPLRARVWKFYAWKQKKSDPLRAFQMCESNQWNLGLNNTNSGSTGIGFFVFCHTAYKRMFLEQGL